LGLFGSISWCLGLFVSRPTHSYLTLDRRSSSLLCCRCNPPFPATSSLTLKVLSFRSFQMDRAVKTTMMSK
uniref:Uncharacterized protein n=1 Tax=Oryza brachyantha TaxID=4533 RepID=J3LKD8_ORYBR